MHITVAPGLAPSTAQRSAIPDVRKRPPPRRSRAAVWLFLLSLMAFATTLGLLSLRTGLEDTIAGAGFALAAILGLAGALSALVSLIAHWPRLSFAAVAQLFVLFTTNGVMALVGAIATLLSVSDFRRGRQLRRRGRVLLPPITDAESWAKCTPALEMIPDALRPALAAQWRENGRTEHASVAAFGRLSLDLLALGAPPTLIACAQRDALDEVHHAQLCFALARSIDGAAHGPGAFVAVRDIRPLSGGRKLRLARLAVDSLIDGALHEGVSARVLARLAKRTDVVPIRALLKQLAADEGRHAAHGWDVVAWCVAEGGHDVIDALDGAVAALPETMTSPLPADARSGGWEPFGIHGHALEAEEYKKARAEVARRVRGLRKRSIAA